MCAFTGCKHNLQTKKCKNVLLNKIAKKNMHINEFIENRL